MAITTTTKILAAFKALFRREHTTPEKEARNEAHVPTINLDASEVWFDALDPDPSVAVTDGFVVQVTGDFELDPDSDGHAYRLLWPATPPSGTDPANSLAYAYGAGSLTGIAAGDRLLRSAGTYYGGGYEVEVYDSGPDRIAPGDLRGWYFNYSSGTFYQEESADVSPAHGGSTRGAPLTGVVYFYIGRTAGSGSATDVPYYEVVEVPEGTLLGRDSAGAGDAEAISVGAGLSLDAGSPYPVLSVDEVDFDQLVDIPEETLLGRWASAGTGPIQSVTLGDGLELSSTGVLDLSASASQWLESAIAIQNAPPVSPADGDRYVVGTSPTGAWSANARDVATWDESLSPDQWTFYDALTGDTIVLTSLVTPNNVYQFNGSNWVLTNVVNAFIQGGNAFGVTAILGTTDANNLSIRTGGVQRILLSGLSNQVRFIGGILLGANSAAASTAPIRFTSSTTLMTTPETGAIEYTTRGLFFTNSGGTRFNLLGFGSAATGGSILMGFFPNVSNSGLGGNTMLGISPSLGLTTGYNNVLLGYEAGYGLTTGSDCVGIGPYVQMGTGTSRSVYIGSAAGSTYNNGRVILIGAQATTTGAYSSSIGIGALAEVTASNQCTIGSAYEDLQITEFIFGGPRTSTTYNDNGRLTFTWKIPQRYRPLASQVDLNGHDLVIQSGLSTGEHPNYLYGGNIHFDTPAYNASSGTTLNVATRRVSIEGGTGSFYFQSDSAFRISSTQTYAKLAVQATTNASTPMIVFNAAGTLMFQIDASNVSVFPTAGGGQFTVGANSNGGATFGVRPPGAGDIAYFQNSSGTNILSLSGSERIVFQSALSGGGRMFINHSSGSDAMFSVKSKTGVYSLMLKDSTDTEWMYATDSKQLLLLGNSKVWIGATADAAGGAQLQIKDIAAVSPSITWAIAVVNSGNDGVKFGVESASGMLRTTASVTVGVSALTSDTTRTLEELLPVETISASGGAVTLTLPSDPDPDSIGSGPITTVKKTDSTVNTVTVAGAGGLLIDGQSSYVLYSQYAWVSLHGSDAGWAIVGRSIQHRVVGATTTLDHSDDIVDAFNGTYDVNMPAIATMPYGRRFTITNIGAGTITVMPDGSETIGGNASIVLSPQNSLTINRAGNTDWIIQVLF